MNRLQNKIELLIGDFKTERPPIQGVKTKTIYSETAKTYIDVHDNLTFLDGMSEFLWTSEKDGFNHIYLIKDNKETKITSGEWEVTEIYGYNATDKCVYFQAAKEHPTQREVYCVNIETLNLRKLSTQSGTNSAESVSYTHLTLPTKA